MRVRECPEELTLKAEDVGTWKSCIDVDHIAKESWGPPLADAVWHFFCQAIYQGVEREDWRELRDCCKEMGKAAGVKKPHEAPKSEKAVWKMKAAKDSGYPDREDILGRNKTRLEIVGRAPQRSDRGTGQNSGVCVWKIRAGGFLV